MGSLRLSRELTQSYPDRAEVQDFFHLLSPGLSLRPLLQGLSQKWPPPTRLHSSQAAGGPAGAKPFCSGGGRQGLRVRAASLASTASPQTPLSLLPSPLPRQPATPGSVRWDIPSPGGRRGRLTQQKPPSPPGPGAPGRGSGSRWGFARPVLFGPGPPPGLPARRFLTSSTKSIARARAGRSPRAAPRFSSRDNGGSLWPNQPPEGPGGRERFPRGRR